MKSFVAKFLQYFLGLIVLLLTSSVLGKKNFGNYSLIQSCLELCTILSGFGASALFARDSVKNKKPPNLRFLSNSIIIGVPFSLLFINGYYIFLENKLNNSIVFGELLVSFFSSVLAAFIILIGSGVKYFDSGVYINYESIGRSLLMMIFLLIAYFVKFNVDVILILVVALISYLVSAIFGAYVIKRVSTDFGAAEIKHDFRSRLDSFVYSVSSFFSKKSDLILLGIFCQAEYLGGFKIAFLIFEIPTQFLHTYINSSAKEISRFNNFRRDGVYKLFKAIKKSLLSSIFVLVLLIIGIILSKHFVFMEEYIIFWYLAPYFAIKSISINIEAIIVSNSREGIFSMLAFFSGLIKAILISSCYWLGVDWLAFAFILSAVFELFLWWCGLFFLSDNFAKIS